jgi:hypothetical protein
VAPVVAISKEAATAEDLLLKLLSQRLQMKIFKNRLRKPLHV